MNDVIDELREKNEDRFGSIELPDLDLIVEIEEQLLISLPIEFKEYLLSLSDVVFGKIEPVTISDPNMHSFLPEIASQAWNQGVPRHLIPICEYNGQYFVVEQDGVVKYWLDGELSDNEWDSVWHWIEDVWLLQNLP
ncbi:SMI1/KNR4 family protein [Pleionea sediminis]|uniref:SMI1/KNR4 family protein n=1 Tax=Pleionea sediminis TaxID=2569479 RepID=UPI0011847008|nr:SMI1/KNR4 family protein [Pleionea sediminis]